MKDYYGQLYTNKIVKLEEMNRFLETYNLQKLNHENLVNLNRVITSQEIESVIKNFPTNKHSRQNSFTGEVYQIFREELTPILLKPFQKNCRGRNTSELTL